MDNLIHSRNNYEENANETLMNPHKGQKQHQQQKQKLSRTKEYNYT